LIDPCPEVKSSKKIHITKQKRYPWLWLLSLQLG
jgi:hypothetical protein